jgi:S1-C subfamily serine protease
MSWLLKIFLLSAAFVFSSCGSSLNSQEKQDIEIFKKSRDSVVFISTSSKVVDYSTLTRYTIPKGSGSGFVWSKDGYIITNFHVIKDANSATVKLRDGKTYNAYLVGTYPRRDIAVLKIDAPKSKLHPVTLGSSKNLQVGQSVYAIGNPYGLDWTMTKGIISALNRKIPSSDGIFVTGAIQTDAAINPGNSGGVMLNSSAEVIGVNSVIYTPSGGSVGIGFAIPIDYVKKVVEKIIKYGKYIKPSIGIEVDSRVNRYLKESFGIEGVAVLGVLANSDAAAKGLKSARFYSDGVVDFGDIITSVNGKRVKSIEDLDDILEELKIGSDVKLEILRGKKSISLEVKLVGLES